MMSINRYRSVGPVAILLAVFALSACQMSETPQQSDGLATTPEPPAEIPELASRPSEPSRSVSSPIGLRYEILGEPRVGESLQIRITSQSQVVIREMALQAHGDEGLSVSPSTADPILGEVAVGEPITRMVTVTPLAEGSHRLSVSVQGEINGVLQDNNVTIRIELGGAKKALQPAGALRTDDKGEPIISLPLEES